MNQPYVYTSPLPPEWLSHAPDPTLLGHHRAPSSASHYLFHTQQCIYVSPNLPVHRRQWHPTPVLVPGKSHGRRSLVGYSPWGCSESDMTERLHFHFSLPCIGDRNGNPLQCSCLRNPRDWGAWWAAISGVAQSRTRLKRLSSSSNSNLPVSPTLPLTPCSYVHSLHLCLYS